MRLLSILLPLITAALLNAASDRPNILLILADDMGYADLGCMGGDAETPYLDKLAADGVLFTNFMNNSKCAPSRASLMTGMSNHKTGADHGSGNLAKQGAMTIAELLGDDYVNLMIDKWHIGPKAWEVGFERYFGCPLSAVFFWPTDKKTQGKMKLDGEDYTDADFTVPLEEWYLTVEDTNYAIKFLEEEVVAKGKEKPFFMYYASHAPHWPLQAPRADTARYMDVYADGTDAARLRRYQRQVESGIVDPEICKLSESEQPSWDELSAEDKDYYQHAMAIHTAMVYRMDQELGRLFKYLKANDLYDNTLIFFMSDNGASGEGYSQGRVIPEGRQLGDRDTYGRIDGIGANVFNTPLRKAKASLYEGGVGTPLIVHWPDGIKNTGVIYDQVGHLYDIFPTVMEVTGAPYPKTYDGRTLKSLDGISLLPAIQGEDAVDRTICLYYEGRAMIRDGKWKLIKRYSRSKKNKNQDVPWELYDMQLDRSETQDVSAQHPEVVQSLETKWLEWNASVDAHH